MGVLDYGKQKPKVPSVKSSDVGSGSNRILPRQVSTGTMRGTQNVGYGNTKIDGSNNRITIGTPDGGTVGMGSIPGTSPEEFGFFSTDADGNVIMKIVDGTIYTYNLDNGNNVIQIGLLTNGVYGAAFSKSGEDLPEALDG